MKKSLIALAVSSAVVAPASVQAAEVYGFVNSTIENGSTENGGAASTANGIPFVIFNTNGNGTEESGTGLSDTAATRLGVTGSEDLGNGLTAGYAFEFDVATSFGGSGGSSNEDSTLSTRLTNVYLSGDFGTVTMGTQWGVIYEYAGWNVYRTDGHGGATHYYMTGGLEDDPYGLRVDNTLEYTYGGGGYSSDPFTFSVQARMDGNGENTAQAGASIDDDETIDSITFGAQGTLPGNVTLNGVIHSESNTSGNGTTVPEQTLVTLGGRWSSGPFYVGGTFYSLDRDTGGSQGEEPTAINVLGGMDFGSGYSGYVGVGSGDADTSSGFGDMSTFFLQAEKAFSSRTKIYAEFETATIDNVGVNAAGNPDGSDGETQVLAFGIKHSF